MHKNISAAVVYFALVMAAGFALGMLRLPLLVPRIGERWAELTEMPIMAAAIFFSAAYILRRFPEINKPANALIVGWLALTLMVCAELGLAVTLQNQTLAEYVASRDKVSGTVYLGMLIVFALMPWFRLRPHK
ncbi:hypothetical protein ELE36_08620 [Pseudolysobacter antarcticus]|uniref:Uncharacterized protein n=1 Tax=Pseudolysobacter antarcticus TaxID=2511995 RepID=A0A411HIU0_9GAMM|nr:hypothetical protein [Pseudolysobacter antarcticus]QBB70425.1 hypothetical protein ELE36_08620 [Pseudolysobacter antarcticus]